MDKGLKKKIKELEKRIETLERLRCCGGCGHMPYYPFNPSPQLTPTYYWCNWCQRYNCGQTHVIC